MLCSFVVFVRFVGFLFLFANAPVCLVANTEWITHLHSIWIANRIFCILYLCFFDKKRKSWNYLCVREWVECVSCAIPKKDNHAHRAQRNCVHRWFLVSQLVHAGHLWRIVYFLWLSNRRRSVSEYERGSRLFALYLSQGVPMNVRINCNRENRSLWPCLVIWRRHQRRWCKSGSVSRGSLSPWMRNKTMCLPSCLTK